jgi:hypothetical protein
MRQSRENGLTLAMEAVEERETCGGDCRMTRGNKGHGHSESGGGEGASKSDE